MGAEFKCDSGCLKVIYKGEIDHHTAKELCVETDIKITLLRPQKVFLDFGFVTFMDSSGLAVAVGRKKLCDRLKIKMFIVNISGYPEKILRMAGIDKLIDFLEDENEV